MRNRIVQFIHWLHLNEIVSPQIQRAILYAGIIIAGMYALSNDHGQSLGPGVVSFLFNDEQLDADDQSIRIMVSMPPCTPVVYWHILSIDSNIAGFTLRERCCPHLEPLAPYESEIAEQLQLFFPCHIERAYVWDTDVLVVQKTDAMDWHYVACATRGLLYGIFEKKSANCN